MSLTKQESVDLDLILTAVKREVIRARAKHPGFPSTHHGLGVLHEEFIELQEHVYHDTTHTANCQKEAIQVAAMGVRFQLELLMQYKHPVA